MKGNYMTNYDMAIEWIRHGEQSLIETEYDGMECDGSSEPFEYSNGYEGDQPNA